MVWRPIQKWKMHIFYHFRGDVGMNKMVSIFDLGHSKSHCLVPKIGHLWQKCQFSIVGEKTWFRWTHSLEDPFEMF